MKALLFIRVLGAAKRVEETKQQSTFFRYLKAIHVNGNITAAIFASVSIEAEQFPEKSRCFFSVCGGGREQHIK